MRRPSRLVGLGSHDASRTDELQNVGRFAVVADPQGAVFAFIALEPHPK